MPANRYIVSHFCALLAHRRQSGRQGSPYRPVTLSPTCSPAARVPPSQPAVLARCRAVGELGRSGRSRWPAVQSVFGLARSRVGLVGGEAKVGAGHLTIVTITLALQWPGGHSGLHRDTKGFAEVGMGKGKAGMEPGRLHEALEVLLHLPAPFGCCTHRNPNMAKIRFPWWKYCHAALHRKVSTDTIPDPISTCTCEATNSPGSAYGAYHPELLVAVCKQLSNHSCLQLIIILVIRTHFCMYKWVRIKCHRRSCQTGFPACLCPSFCHRPLEGYVSHLCQCCLSASCANACRDSPTPNWLCTAVGMVLGSWQAHVRSYSRPVTKMRKSMYDLGMRSLCYIRVYPELILGINLKALQSHWLVH